MKLSMSMIAKRLKGYDFSANLTRDAATITNLRALVPGLEMLGNEYVYLGNPHDIDLDGEDDGTMIVIHGTDSIYIRTSSRLELLNRLLSTFDYYNSWEQQLIELAERNTPLQMMLDVSDEVLDNPCFVMDYEGNLLAISPYHEDRLETDFYASFRENGTVDPKSTSLAMTDRTGKSVHYNSESLPLIVPGNDAQMPFLPATIMCDLEPVAIFIVSQSAKQPASLNRNLIRVMLKHLGAAEEFQSNAQHPQLYSTILHSLLDGRKLDDASRVRLASSALTIPYTLLVFKTKVDSDTSSQRLNAGQLSHSLNQIGFNSIHTIYGPDAVAMVSERDADNIVREIKKTFGLKNWQVGYSLPFTNIDTIPLRYRQARFAITQADGKPGVFRCEDHAMEYLLAKVRSSDEGLELRHPAIIILKHYDEEHGTELGETLFQYLRFERNLVHASNQLCVHRNSLAYRLKRIREICHIDFEDPEENMYILLSYYLDHLDSGTSRQMLDRTYSSISAKTKYE